MCTGKHGKWEPRRYGYVVLRSSVLWLVDIRHWQRWGGQLSCQAMVVSSSPRNQE
jgi:hypothetical protein